MYRISDNPFQKYNMYIKENGRIVDMNPPSVSVANEAFNLFKALFSHDFGSIEEDENLVAIHTGGWSDNEELVNQFKETVWWFLHFRIKSVGGHYYFNTDTEKELDWYVTKHK